jgi:hypothetical protein
VCVVVVVVGVRLGISSLLCSPRNMVKSSLEVQ